MNYMILTYSIYIGLSVLLTVWVARTLHKNGRVFLVDSFHGDDALADSINHLLVVGFYLVNLGFVCLYLKLTKAVENGQEVFEGLGSKLGIVLLVLGGMHFMNLFIFNRLRRNSEDRKLMMPPVRPNSLTTPPGRTAASASIPPPPPKM